ncbi:MAG: peptidoglycan DD-metalloendopeptidase family protein [Candidatus Peribacteraceae bacterium]
MSLNPKTHIVSVLVLVSLVTAAGMVGAAEVSEQILSETKAGYEELWHAAAAVTEKRATLEAELATFDDRVKDARLTIEQIATLRGELRIEIADSRDKLKAIQSELRALDHADTYYASLSVRLRSTLADFARFIAEREIVADGGPGSSSVLEPLLNGSLGQSVDDALARDAVMRARVILLSQAGVITQESEHIRQSLSAKAQEYAVHMASLEEEQKKLGKDELKAAAFVDQSWRQKTLTQSELSAIAIEAKEASDRIAAMQEDLLKINDELKQKKIASLSEQKTQLTQDLESLNAEIEVLERRDSAKRLLEEDALKAQEQTIVLKNTDRKIYQKIELQELKRKNLREERDKLSAVEIIDSVRVNEIDREVAVIDATIALMRTGVPEDAARSAVIKKNLATDATAERRTIKESIDELSQKLSEVERSHSTVVAAIDSVEKEFSLESLPPIFIWPVKGIITADFHDADYVHVFGVAHQAIDIAVVQGTPVKAITDGIVQATRDGGALGYSYVLIGHRNGYASVYGHVSKFLVSPGDYVKAGQVIALSGGTPGTHGAGRMTTGAHLHLEVLHDGVHVDPRTVLR